MGTGGGELALKEIEGPIVKVILGGPAAAVMVGVLAHNVNDHSTFAAFLPFVIICDEVSCFHPVHSAVSCCLIPTMLTDPLVLVNAFNRQSGLQ